MTMDNGVLIAFGVATALVALVTLAGLILRRNAVKSVLPLLIAEIKNAFGGELPRIRFNFDGVVQVRPLTVADLSSWLSVRLDDVTWIKVTFSLLTGDQESNHITYIRHSDETVTDFCRRITKSMLRRKDADGVVRVGRAE